MSKCRVTLAVVIKVEDEESRVINTNRVQVRIPTIHGPMTPDKLPPGSDQFTQWTPDEYLPWVSVIYPLGTKSPDKASMFQEKELVYVMFGTDDTTRPFVVGTTGVVIEE